MEFSGNCSYEHTEKLSAGGNCECFPPFYGPLCESTYAYWQPTTIVLTSLELLYLAVAIYWNSMKLIYVLKRGSFAKATLVNIVLVLNGVALLARTTMHLIVSPGNSGVWHRPAWEGVVKTVLVVVPISLWMASSALVVGFWFDILVRRLRRTMAHRTRIVCIIGSIIVFLAVPGQIMALNTTGVAQQIGVVLVLFPLLVDTTGLIIIASIVTRHLRQTRAVLNDANITKAEYALKWLWVNACVWIAFVVNVAVGAFLLTNINGTPLVHVTMPFGFIVVVTTSLTSLSILYLCDRNGGPIVMTRLVCGCGRAAQRAKSPAKSIAYSQESTVTVDVSLDLEDQDCAAVRT
jgi:hypothetical protein